MKSLKSKVLLFAGLFLMLGAWAQSAQTGQSGTSEKSTTKQPGGVSTSTTDNTKNKTKTMVRKEKTKTTTHPDGTSTTITKSKPTNKSDNTKTK